MVRPTDTPCLSGFFARSVLTAMIAERTIRPGQTKKSGRPRRTAHFCSLQNIQRRERIRTLKPRRELMVMKVRVSPDSIAGHVDEGYGKLADVFRRNMTSGQEIGAAVAVYRDGKKVVDLWGGYRNGVTKAPWQEDTLITMMSTTKGVSALVVAVAASRGLISYDAPVADYWPEFAQADKGAVTVRQLLSHPAG